MIYLYGERSYMLVPGKLQTLLSRIPSVGGEGKTIEKDGYRQTWSGGSPRQELQSVGHRDEAFPLCLHSPATPVPISLPWTASAEMFNF